MKTQIVYTDPRVLAPEKGARFHIVLKAKRYRVQRLPDLFCLSTHGELEQAVKSGHAYYYEKPDGGSL